METIRPSNNDENVEGNPIGSLQEMCVAFDYELPTYEDISEIGMPHLKEFTVECKMLSRREIGKGKTKKIAKKIAAHKMWSGIQERPINKIEVSKILSEEQNQKGEMTGMTTNELMSPKIPTSRKTKQHFVTMTSAKREAKRNVPIFSKFGNHINNSTKGKARNEYEGISTDTIVSDLQELCLSSPTENKKQIVGTEKKIKPTTLKKSWNDENLKRISLQEVSLFSERNVPFKAMAAEFSKTEGKPCKEKEKSRSETENKPFNNKKIITSNPIGHLQEMCVARGWPLPEYISKFENHGQQFIVECKILQYTEIGEEKNKKLAKKLAAHKMWSRLEEKNSLETN